MPFKFNLENIDKTGLDVLFYGQEHFDTMSIVSGEEHEDRRNISQDTIREQLKNQKILSNRALLLKNLYNLTESLTECEEYIQNVIDNKIVGDSEIGRKMNKCMGQFNSEDMTLLEQLVHSNFKDAMMTNNLLKL